MQRPGWTSRHLIAAVVTFVALVGLGATATFLISLEPDDANVLSGTYSFLLSIAVATIPVGFMVWRWALRKDSSQESVLRNLRIEILETEQIVRDGLLGEFGPARWSFRHSSREEESSRRRRIRRALGLFRFSNRSGHDLGNLGKIDRYYNSVESGRLVIIGEKGSGKTVAAVQLVLKLMGQRNKDISELPNPIVPVRFDMAGWNTNQAIREWMSHDLYNRFSIDRAMAKELVDRGLILPILDGLDEMDQDSFGSDAVPVRALQAVKHLNAYFDSDKRAPFILLTRPHRYLDLGSARLLDVEEIYVDPLNSDQISEYLKDRYSGTTTISSWRQVVARLSPGSLELDVLSTPWKLLLATTAVDGGALPSNMFARRAQESLDEAALRIESELLGSYIPAAARLSRAWRKARTSEKYDPDRVRVWLTTVSRLLMQQRAQLLSSGNVPPALTGIDLVPHLMWPALGSWRVRIVHLALVLLSAGIPLYFLVMAVAGPLTAWPSLLKYAVTDMSLIGYEVPLLELEPTDQKAFLLIGAIIAIAVLSTGALKSWHRLNPRKSRDLIRPGNFRERMRKFVEAAAGAALLAFVVGGGTWLYADWATARQAFSMIFSLLIVVGLGQVIFGDRRAIPFVKPYDSFKRELPPVLVAAVVSPAIAGLVIQRFNPGALLPGVIAAAVVAILGNCPLYVRYMSMVLIGSISRSFPGRPGKFLDWCCTSGILRFAGSSYQFRHVELQTWLCPVTKQSSDGPIVDLGSSSEDATDGDEPGPPDEELSRAFNIALREVRNDADLNRRTRHWGIPITEIIMRLEQSRVLILHEVDDVFTTYSTTWNWIASSRNEITYRFDLSLMV